MFTQEQVDALKKAIAGGRLESEYQGKRVKWRSLDEMVRALRLAENELGTGSGSIRSRMRVAEHDTGIRSC